MLGHDAVWNVLGQLDGRTLAEDAAMTRILKVITFFLLLNCFGGILVSGQDDTEADDLLDEVERRLLEEGDYVPNAVQTGSRHRTGRQTTAAEVGSAPSHACGAADVLHGACSTDGTVCPLAGRHSFYIKCVHGHWLSMPCAPGTMFDLSSKSCASPHDIQPPPFNNHPRAPEPHPPTAAETDIREEQERPAIQNDSPSPHPHYGSRLVGFMDFPPPGYHHPFHPAGFPGHYPQAGQTGQYAPPNAYSPVAVSYQPVGQPAEQAPEPKEKASTKPKAATESEDGQITESSGQMCNIGTYRAVPKSKKYYEHCVHSGSSSSQWMRRLCPPGMVADDNPVELPCRFSLNFAPAVKNHQEQDTKPKTPVSMTQYNYKVVQPAPRKTNSAAPTPHVQNHQHHRQYVPAPVPVPQAHQPQHPQQYNKPKYVYYYQSTKKQEQPVHQGINWNQNVPSYTPDEPDRNQEPQNNRDPFQNGEREIHNVEPEPYDVNQGTKEEQNRYDVDWSQAGRQGNVVDPNEAQGPEPVQLPQSYQPEIPRVRFVNVKPEPTTLPTTQQTEPTTPVTIQTKPTTEEIPEAPVTVAPAPLEPEAKETPPKSPTQLYPNYMDNAEFMKILKDLAAKYIDNVSKGQNSTLNDKPTEESVIDAAENTENDDENKANNVPENSNVDIPNKDNDVILDFNSGRYELPFIVDMEDLVLWPRDVAAGGEKTEDEKVNHANPFYLLKLPNTAASSNEAAAQAAGFRSADQNENS